MCYQQEYKCMINIRMHLLSVSYDKEISLKSPRKITNNVSKERVDFPEISFVTSLPLQ